MKKLKTAEDLSEAIEDMGLEEVLKGITKRMSEVERVVLERVIDEFFENISPEDLEQFEETLVIDVSDELESNQE
jgi:hypothetical protein